MVACSQRLEVVGNMRISLDREVEICGINVFNGNRNNARIIPYDGEGIVFVVKGEEIPVNLENSFVYRPWKTLKLAQCIGLHGKKNDVKKIEHFLAALYALKIDDALIELSDGVCPRLNFGVGGVVDAVSDKRKEKPGERNYFHINPDSDSERKITNGRSSLTIENSDSNYIYYGIDFPHRSIGKQSYRLNLTEEVFKREIMKARGIIPLPFGSKTILKLLKPYFGVRDKNSLLIGKIKDNHFANNSFPFGVYGKSEYVRHQIMDVIGTLALTGGYFQNTGFKFSQGDHDFELSSIKELFKRGVFLRS